MGLRERIERIKKDAITYFYMGNDMKYDFELSLLKRQSYKNIDKPYLVKSLFFGWLEKVKPTL